MMFNKLKNKAIQEKIDSLTIQEKTYMNSKVSILSHYKITRTILSAAGLIIALICAMFAHSSYYRVNELVGISNYISQYQIDMVWGIIMMIVFLAYSIFMPKSKEEKELEQEIENDLEKLSSKKKK